MDVNDRDSCIFCRIIDGKTPANDLWTWPEAVAFTPLNPVTKGHILVVPKEHVADATVDPEISALTMAAAADVAYMKAPANIITSIGRIATQTVFHLHLHVVPRREDDGLLLPWTTVRGED